MAYKVLFSIGVTLSSKSYPEELFIVGINDLEKKNFRKLSLDDIIKEVYSSPELRFQYFFKTEQSLHEFIADQANEDFEVLKENSHIPIFDKTGNFSTTLYEKMKAVEHLAIHEAPGSGAVAHVFPLQGENYIKILPSGKLVQIMAVREERYILSRL